MTVCRSQRGLLFKYGMVVEEDIYAISMVFPDNMSSIKFFLQKKTQDKIDRDCFVSYRC